MLLRVVFWGVLGFHAACQSPGTPTAFPLPAKDRGELQKLLDEAWASNGTLGFFVDQGYSRRNTYSLYLTAYWSRVMERQQPLAKTLQKEAVASWVLPLLHDRDIEESADTSGMPELAKIAASLDLALRMQIDFDRVTVVQRIEKLRLGPLYRSDRKDSVGDWGSTALALSLLRKMGYESAPEVRQHVRDALKKVVRSQAGVELTMDEVLPVLASAGPSDLQDFRRLILQQLARIERLLPSMTEFERINAAGMASGILRQTGAKAWPLDLICRDLIRTADGILLGEGAPVDPQLTAKAAEVGCTVQARPPPWTSAGWLSQQALGTALQASIAGLRIAEATGQGARYRERLQAQLEKIWMPSVIHDIRSGGESGNLTSLYLLSRLLNQPSPMPKDLDQKLTFAFGRNGYGQLAPLLLMSHLSGRTIRLSSAAPEVDAEGTIYAAAEQELKFRLSGVQQYQTNSRRILDRLNIKGHLYDFAPQGSGQARPQPSVVASAIAAWILRKDTPVEVFQQAGLCSQAGICAASGNVHPVDTSLSATAAWIALRFPDQASFPAAL